MYCLVLVTMSLVVHFYELYVCFRSHHHRGHHWGGALPQPKAGLKSRGKPPPFSCNGAPFGGW